MAHTLVWFDLPCINLDRAVDFYANVTDRPIRIEAIPTGRMAVFEHGDKDVSGCLFEDDNVKPTAHGALIYFDVTGRLEDAVQKAIKWNGKVLQDKHSIGPFGFRAVVLDSEGNRIALYSETDS